MSELKHPFLAAPVVDLSSAKAWVQQLVEHGMDFHLEDDPGDITNGFNDGGLLFTPDEIKVVRERVKQLYQQDWGPRFQCPIGYLLYWIDTAHTRK